MFIKKSKQYYTYLKIQKQLQPKSFNFWANKFQDFSFEKFHNNTIKPMHVAKVRKYPYKIIHNIGVCGEILFRFNLIQKNIFIVTVKVILLNICFGNVNNVNNGNNYGNLSK